MTVREEREHVPCDGFCKSYAQWTWHDELLDIHNVSEKGDVDVDMDDQLEDMIHDIGVEAKNNQGMT